jgi:Ca-activated chloride channel family protein
MKRPEKHFWYYVAILSGVLLLGLSGQLISCAKAEPHRGAHYHPRHSADEPIQPWNVPGPSVTSSPDVSLRAALDRGAIMENGDGIVRVEVTMKPGAETYAVPNQASDIVVVVDTSGSMEGQKIHFAKQALSALVERLGDQDRFSLVEYNYAARTVVPLSYATPYNKERFLAATSGLVADGSTNMSDGLDRAIGTLTQERDGARPGRVILLSDGLANAGDSSLSGLSSRARALSSQNFALSTMGVGEDFDEHVMTQLATVGTGAFYYLSKLSYLAEFFESELASTRHTYASAATIHFQPAPGVYLLDAMGLPVEARGAEKVVRVGNLYGSRSRTVWLTLKVPSGRVGSQDLGHLSLTYERNGQRGYATVGALPEVVCVADYGIFKDHVHEQVWERAVMNNVFSTTQERFGDAIRSGSKAELEAALKEAESERRLAQSLGNHSVLSQLDHLKAEAVVAEQAQSAPAPVRNMEAKKSKARGYQKRNSDAYENSSRALEAY